jgi:hypothetical protein
MLDRREDIKRIYFQLYKKARSFLLSEQSRKFLVFLFFFVVAAGFWLIQTLNRDYETDILMPVRLEHVPQNAVVTSPPPSSIRLRVKDKGTVLIHYLLGKHLSPIRLDFAHYHDKAGYVKIPVARLEKEMENLLNASTNVMSIHPDTLSYVYSVGRAKRVPVRLQGKVSAGLQYYVSDTLFSHDSILVYAPQHTLDTLRAAYTQPVAISDISDTTRTRVQLAPVEGAKFVPDEVTVTFPVDIYTEKTIEVPLVGIGFPPDKALRAFPSKVQVTFQVGLKHFRSIHESDFSINVAYDELLKLGATPYTVRLTAYPADISRIRINPPQVDFLIEQEASPHYNKDRHHWRHRPRKERSGPPATDDGCTRLHLRHRGQTPHTGRPHHPATTHQLGRSRRVPRSMP